MTNHTIDNSSDEEFGKVILWQYDKAENLVTLIKSFLGIHDSATKDLWDRMQKELDVDTASEFGLSILGSLLGVPWCTYRNSTTRIGVEYYRRWIKAWAVLIRTDFTVPDVFQFFKDVTLLSGSSFYAPRDASVVTSKVMALDLAKVRLSTTESGLTTAEIVEDESDIIYIDDELKVTDVDWAYTVNNAKTANGHPAAVRANSSVDNAIIFGFDGQQYKSKGDCQIGGFDDSTFIPTDEYVTETY